MDQPARVARSAAWLAGVILGVVMLGVAPARWNLLSAHSAARAAGGRRLAPAVLPQAGRALGFLQFIISTGEDDLRGDSKVDVTIAYPDHTITQCPIKHDDASWANGSTHTAPPCKLTKPARLGVLRESTITLTENGVGSIVEGWDNWNIQRVRVIAYNQGSAAKPDCVFDVSGSPLVRLTVANTVAINEFPNHCGR